MTYPCVDSGSTYIFMSHEDDFRAYSQVGYVRGQVSIFSSDTEYIVLKCQAKK